MSFFSLPKKAQCQAKKKMRRKPGERYSVRSINDLLVDVGTVVKINAAVENQMIFANTNTAQKITQQKKSTYTKNNNSTFS
jgi:outer membrane scaffolding protein for murein synthesis (MipA/OmpV family)